MFSTVSTTVSGRTLVVTNTVPCSGRLWTIALCTRFVVICSRSACEPMVGVTSPEVSMVRPRFSARGRSVSVASSAIRDRSTSPRAKDRWSARLSRSSASVRSIARVLTAWRRSTSSPLSRFGSLRATSRSVCVTASGVRSSWEALAANRCCSATCASSRASMLSKASESSRNSSLRPSSWIRWESDPVAAMRAAFVMRVSGASIWPARSHPPRRPNTSRNAVHDRRLRSEGAHEVGAARSAGAGSYEDLGHVAQQEHPDDGEQQGTGEHEEAGVAEGELEADAQTGGSIHGRARCLVGCRCGIRRRRRWR